MRRAAVPDTVKHVPVHLPELSLVRGKAAGHFAGPLCLVLRRGHAHAHTNEYLRAMVQGKRWRGWGHQRGAGNGGRLAKGSAGAGVAAGARFLCTMGAIRPPPAPLARMYVRTHVRTHARTHTRTHTHTHMLGHEQLAGSNRRLQHRAKGRAQGYLVKLSTRQGKT